MISFSENQEESLIAYEDGQPLASQTAPMNQGLKWAYSLGTIPTREVIVIGLGSGFHIAALADVDPSLKISVVETRPSLLRVFRSQFPQLADKVQIVVVDQATDILKTDLFKEVISEAPYVISFQECWGRQAEVFAELFGHLTGRSVESLRYHFEDFGINLKASVVAPRQLLTIKDAMPSVESSLLKENKKQIFRVLNELVK